MSGKKTNYYNITKDGVLIKENVTNREAAEISGCHANSISTYANRCGNKETYHGIDGSDYIFDICGTSETVPRTITDKHAKGGYTDMTVEQKRQWNDIMSASKLLKSGKGRISSRYGKKYVEVIA